MTDLERLLLVLLLKAGLAASAVCGLASAAADAIRVLRDYGEHWEGQG